MFKSWTVLICWEPVWAKETTHMKHASFPVVSTENGKYTKDGAKIKHWPWHPTMAAWRFRVFGSCFFWVNQRCVLDNSVSGSMRLKNKVAVNSVPNFRVGYYIPLSWESQMCASQNCSLMMPLTHGLQGRFGGCSLQRADNGHRSPASVLGTGGQICCWLSWQLLEEPKHLCRFFQRQGKLNPMAQQMQTKASSVACFTRTNVCDKGPQQTALAHINTCNGLCNITATDQNTDHQ